MNKEEAKEFLSHYICCCQYGNSPSDCDDAKCEFGIAIRTLCDEEKTQEDEQICNHTYCETEEMEEQRMIICVSLGEFIRVTTGCIYELAPYHKPRFIDEIVDEIIRLFKANSKSIGTDFFYYEVELKDLYKFIESILMSIDKFRDLNLSPIEYEQGIDIDDPDRQKFQFVSAFNSIPEDDSFVDLDACIQNIFTHYEHNAYRQWVGDAEIDTVRLLEFRQKYSRESRADK